MEKARDLARRDAWRQSLERSLARRGSPSRDSIELRPLPPSRGPARDEGPVHRVPTYRTLCWQAAAKRWPTLVAGAAGILSLVLLAATRPSVSDGRSGPAPPPIRGIRGARANGGPLRAKSGASVAQASRPAVSEQQPCQPASRSAGYVNPLAAAAVTPKRIDQGVDYAGFGALVALGDATVTTIATSDTGWPGAFIEYQIHGGPESGCYVFYAEGVTPAAGLYVGEAVRAGQAIATLDPDNSSGIEIGWGAGEGTATYAAMTGQWSTRAEEENIPTPAGMSFSSLVASLGGPPGRVGG